MPPIYLSFDFGTDEEKAQHARHQLDTWKQAFRLDKKLLYKLDRGETVEAEKPAEVAKPAEPPKSEKPAEAKGKSKAKGKAESAKGKSAAGDKKQQEPSPSAAATAVTNGKVSLLVRLYFSSHEKLSANRWIERIPSEEPFKSASPKIIRQGDTEFDQAQEHFEDLE